MYGLEQSPSVWYLNLLKNLIKDVWIRCELDACLFKKWIEDPDGNDKSKWKTSAESNSAGRGSWTCMWAYADAILIASAETYATNETRNFLESVYRMTDFGWPTDFSGI